MYTGNSLCGLCWRSVGSVYPCVYRELRTLMMKMIFMGWFIPVYTRNSLNDNFKGIENAVYPCVYRELAMHDSDVVMSIRFIPVYTGNSFIFIAER